MSVITKKLHELADVFSGYAFRSEDLGEQGIPVIKIKNVNDKIVYKQCDQFLPINFVTERLKKYLLQNDDILVAMTGQGSLGRIGKMINQKEQYIVNQRVGIVRPKVEDASIAGYLFSVLALDEFEDRLYSLGAGAGQPNVSAVDIGNLDIPYLSRSSRMFIAKIRTSYDALIENNNRRITILEEMAQSLYREWFVNFRYPNHEDILDADGKQKLIDSPLGEIPEGWEIKYIKDIGFINTGKTPSKKKEENYSSRDIPFIKTPDMHGGMFIIKTKEMLSKVGADSQKSKYIPNWAICVSCIGTAGVVSISTQISQTNQQINTFIPKSKKHTEFMYFSFKSLKQTIQNYGATGATMTNLSKGKFEALEIVFPEESLLVNFHRITNPIFKQIQVLSSKNENLKQQRDILLPKLISGQIQLKE
ncbi:restriction endonuclease subunit S [Thorsellia kenyensis]|uniref:Restriction endonuclease subunit S n=1 Tax=Thorsellia kenyensis TaxID=1549888 RepID=A0ABV6C969_9GAMM